MTPAQIKNIHIAKSKCHFSEANYRTLLLNVAGVTTCKDLTNALYEDCMAVFEDFGYRQMIDGVLQAPDYWRRKVASRAHQVNARLVYKIEELFEQYAALATAPGPGKTYSLGCLVERACEGRGRSVSDLTPREAFKLIEMLKAIIARNADVPSAVSSPVPSAVAPADLNTKSRSHEEPVPF